MLEKYIYVEKKANMLKKIYYMLKTNMLKQTSYMFKKISKYVEKKKHIIC